MTLLLEYDGECTIRVISVSVSRLRICSCLLFYGSLIINPILPSFAKGLLKGLMNVHSKF